MWNKTRLQRFQTLYLRTFAKSKDQLLLASDWIRARSSRGLIYSCRSANVAHYWSSMFTAWSSVAVLKWKKNNKHLSLLLTGSSSNFGTVNILPVVLAATIIAHGQHATLQCDSPRSWTMPPLLKSKQRPSAGLPLEGSLQGLSHRALRPASRPPPSSSSAATAACRAAVHAGSCESTSSDTMRPACFSL